MRKLILLTACVITLLLTSCSVDDNSPRYHLIPLEVVSADLPPSFELNESYEIAVTYAIPNGCTFFDGFDITPVEQSTRNVVPIGSQFDDPDCVDGGQEVESSFRFVVLYTDTYLFRFYTGKNADGEDEFLEVEVPVNQ